MKCLTRIFTVLVLYTCVQTAWAQAAGEVDDSYRRLTEAVSKARGGETIRPQATGATAVTRGAQESDQQLSALAQALSAQQTEESTQAQVAQPQQQQQQQVNPTQQQLTIKDEAFLGMTSVALPLSPNQIKRLRLLFTGAQRAAAQHPGVPPKPTSSSVVVNLSPGATPPIIRLSAGFVSSLVFVDATGAPWPIAAWDLGDPRSYNIQWDKKGNTLMVQAITQYKSGNLAVILKDMHTPIMVTLLPGQKAVDYRVDLRIPSLGPNAQTTTMGLPSSGNVLLLNILNGVPPTGAQKLRISGAEAEVWQIGGHLFVRTRLTILSPGWIATMSSGDGLHAYEIQKTPLILASYHGKMVKLIVQGL